MKVGEGRTEVVDEEVIECKNPVDGFTIGHRKKSQTAVIRTYDNSVTGLPFCDSPGLDDTDGTEIDIANGVGIANTLLRANSARIVLCMDPAQLGLDKGQHLVEFIKLITHFIKDLESHLDSIVVLFTRETTLTSVQREVTKLAGEQHIQNQPTVHRFVLHLLDDIKKYKTLLLVEPLAAEKREALVSHIKALKAIKASPDTIGFPLSFKGQTTLHNHCISVSSKVQRAISRRDVSQLHKSLDEVKLLADEISTTELKELYSKSTNLVNQAVLETITVISSRLESYEFEPVKESMESLRKMRLLKEHLGLLDVNSNYQAFQISINRTAASLEQAISEESSYLVISQKMTSLNEIQKHLDSHLFEDNHEIYLRTKSSVQSRLDTLSNKISEELKRVESGENIDSNLTSSLSQNLNILAKVEYLRDHLSRQYCSLYTDKITSLHEMIEKNFLRFRGFLDSNVTTTKDLSVSYKIVKAIEDNRELCVHILQDKRRFTQLNTLLLEHIEQLKQKLETLAHEHNYSAVKETLQLLNAFLDIDEKIGPNYRTKKLNHTLQLLEKQLKATEDELNEKVRLEVLGNESKDGIAYIQNKILLLVAAKDLEKELSDPGMVSLKLITFPKIAVAKSLK